MSASRHLLQRMAALQREVVRVYRKDGFWTVMHRGGRRVFEETRNRLLSHKSRVDSFDAEYGTDTGGIVDAGALDLPPDRVDHAVRYQTAIIEVFIGLLQELGIVFEDFVFVDLGSGKGRALLLASGLPFKEVIGVELSATLHLIACRNIEIFPAARKRCNRIKSVCQDAASFDFPHDNTVVYLFNPFGEPVLREVVKRIETSLRHFPRALYIIYLKPVHRHLFDVSDYLTTVKATERYVIYHNRRPASAD